MKQVYQEKNNVCSFFNSKPFEFKTNSLPSAEVYSEDLKPILQNKILLNCNNSFLKTPIIFCQKQNITTPHFL